MLRPGNVGASLSHCVCLIILLPAAFPWKRWQEAISHPSSLFGAPVTGQLSTAPAFTFGHFVTDVFVVVQKERHDLQRKRNLWCLGSAWLVCRFAFQTTHAELRKLLFSKELSDTPNKYSQRRLFLFSMHVLGLGLFFLQT